MSSHRCRATHCSGENRIHQHQLFEICQLCFLLQCNQRMDVPCIRCGHARSFLLVYLSTSRVFMMLQASHGCIYGIQFALINGSLGTDHACTQREHHINTCHILAVSVDVLCLVMKQNSNRACIHTLVFHSGLRSSVRTSSMIRF